MNFKRKDGLCILIKESRFKIQSSKLVQFNDVGDRVCIHLFLKDLKNEKNILVSNVHLTFPHNHFDR